MVEFIIPLHVWGKSLENPSRFSMSRGRPVPGGLHPEVPHPRVRVSLESEGHLPLWPPCFTLVSLPKPIRDGQEVGPVETNLTGVQTHPSSISS